MTLEDQHTDRNRFMFFLASLVGRNLKDKLRVVCDDAKRFFLFQSRNCLIFQGFHKGHFFDLSFMNCEFVH
jgi:hypothetical protein